MDLEEAINRRKSIRHYKNVAIDPDVVDKLIDAGTKVPSAGGIHPLKIHLIWSTGLRIELCKAALGQKCVEEAAMCLVIAANAERMTEKYHRRGRRYVYMEAGHAGQNISLMATSLGLGCVMVGAFNDDEVKKVLGIEDDPLYIIPIGVPYAV